VKEHKEELERVEKEKGKKMEQENNRKTPKAPNLDGLEKDEDEEVKTSVPITNRIFPSTKTSTRDLHEDNDKKSNEGDTMKDTHDHRGNSI
jgi:hypothetical protein